jgi:hypothetical protein
MPKARDDRSRASEDGDRGYGGDGGDYGKGGDGGDEGHGREPFDDPGEHLEIERQRFIGGLPPTPELYALARAQWKRLPGSLVSSTTDPVAGDPDPGGQPPGQPGQPGRPAPSGSAR